MVPQHLSWDSHFLRHHFCFIFIRHSWNKCHLLHTMKYAVVTDQFHLFIWTFPFYLKSSFGPRNLSRESSVFLYKNVASWNWPVTTVNGQKLDVTNGSSDDFTVTEKAEKGLIGRPEGQVQCCRETNVAVATLLQGETGLCQPNWNGLTTFWQIFFCSNLNNNKFNFSFLVGLWKVMGLEGHVNFFLLPSLWSKVQLL